MKLIRHFTIPIILLICSCSQSSSTEKELQEVLNTEIKWGQLNTIQHMPSSTINKLLQSYKYKSVIYLQDGCSPCYPKYIEWQQKMDSLDIPDDYTVLFVIKGNSYENFMNRVLDIKNVDNQFYTVMDPEGKFLEANKEIPRWIIDASVLIDSENKIKMVGAPFATPDMTELFHEICAQ